MENKQTWHKTFRLLPAGLLILMLSLIVSVSSQTSKDKLIDKKKKIEEEIEYYKKLLKETQKTKTLSLNQVILLRKQIESRENLITEINTEIIRIENEIEENNFAIRQSNEQLKTLKEEYAGILFHAYKNRKPWTRLMFIFASEDFNEAFNRLNYFRQYDEFRRRQARVILGIQDRITEKNRELASMKQEKTQLLQSSEEEKLKLSREKLEKDNAVKTLRKKENDLRKKLKAREEEARKLQKKIENAISEEIRKSAEKSKKTVSSGTTLKTVMTPEEMLVSDNFSGNKGKLPWPVEKGALSGTFGEHPHPVLSGITVKNNGIDIVTSPGAKARAVFGGSVSSVISITNTNKAVIIRHGEFFTVYSNLSDISVSKGQNVSAKQSLGTVYTNTEEGKTELHFEIWQGKVLCNPSDWLTRR